MNMRMMVSMLCISAALYGAGCTGDSLQPTASKNAFTPTAVSDESAARPISDFTSAQGKYCLQNTAGECIYFAPPVANYVTWFSPERNMMIAVDYAGIVDAFVKERSGGEHSLGTQVSGDIKEERMSDGRARVTVHLVTSNASAFIVEGSNLQSGRYLFGTDPRELTDGKGQASYGSAMLHVVFINKAPGMPMPDLVQLMRMPEPGQELVESQFRFEGDGYFQGSTTPSNHISVSHQGKLMPSFPGQEMTTPPVGMSTLQIM